MKKITFSKSDAERIRKYVINNIDGCDIRNNAFILRSKNEMVKVIPVCLVDEKGNNIDKSIHDKTMWKFSIHPVNLNVEIPILEINEDVGMAILKYISGKVSVKDCDKFIYNYANKLISEFYIKGNKVYAK